eukprot:scaffold212972_cov30-Tisochrysis_lutea.AAC.3
MNDLNRQRGKKEYIEDVELDYVNGPSTSGSSVGHEGNEDDSGASAFAAGVGVGGSGPRIRPSPMVAAAEEEAVAAEAWGNHLRRDRSVIVDTFQGQLRSVLKCSHCGAARSFSQTILCGGKAALTLLANRAELGSCGPRLSMISPSYRCHAH